MLTPERRAFLQAAYSTLLRPSAPPEEQPPAPAGEAGQPKPEDDTDSASQKEEPDQAAPE